MKKVEASLNEKRTNALAYPMSSSDLRIKSMKILPAFVVALYFFAIITPAVMAFYLKTDSHSGFYNEAGMFLGITGIMLIFFQFIISARLLWLDRLFGYNNMLSFHRRMGIWAFIFILAHLSFLTLSEREWKMLVSLHVPWFVNLGKATFLVLTLQVLISVYKNKLQFSYERWRAIHDFFAISILILVFIHSFFAGDDLKLIPLQVLWFILPVIGIGFYVWQRFLLFRNAPLYEVTEIVQETTDVHTLHFKPKRGSTLFAYNPGQFHFIRFSNCMHLRSEEHPFTISSSPSQKLYLSSTIKNSGDFTSVIHRIQKGDSVRILGPFGKLSFVEKSHSGPIIFIAGGIGITPFISMLQYMADEKHEREVVLLYFNQTEQTIAFRKELDNLMANNTALNINVVHILSKQKDWQGEQGHFHKDLLKKYIPIPLSENHYYVCGPSRLNNAVLRELKLSQIPAKNMHSERFELAQSGASLTQPDIDVRFISRLIVILLLVMISLMAGVRSGWKMYKEETGHIHDATKGVNQHTKVSETPSAYNYSISGSSSIQNTKPI